MLLLPSSSVQAFPCLRDDKLSYPEQGEDLSEANYRANVNSFYTSMTAAFEII